MSVTYLLQCVNIYQCVYNCRSITCCYRIDFVNFIETISINGATFLYDQPEHQSFKGKRRESVDWNRKVTWRSNKRGSQIHISDLFSLSLCTSLPVNSEIQAVTQVSIHRLHCSTEI